MTTYRIISPAIGRPGTSIYRERLTFGTIEASSKMEALDRLAHTLGVTRIRRTHSIPVMGMGSVTVEPVEESA